MKKIYYLLALVALTIASCSPLDNTYKTLDATPAIQTVTFSTTTAYTTLDLAKTGISALLNTKYGDYPNGTKAVVSFPFSGSITLVANTTAAQDSYTLVAADYSLVTTFTDFSDANVLTYLGVKFPTPVPNQLAILTYNYFLSGVTASSGTITTDSFIYISGAWKKCYTISAAQYTSINRGVNGYFTATDLTNLPFYLENFLDNDASVMATAKAGDVKYISYRTSATAVQVFPLTFNGTAWVNLFAQNFLKLNGSWVPDPTVYVTEAAVGNSPDIVFLNTTTIGTTAGRANVLQYGDFNVQPTSQYFWSDADLTAAFAAILLHRFPSPTPGVPYSVTYYAYNGSDTAVTKVYIFNGTAFVLQ